MSDELAPVELRIADLDAEAHVKQTIQLAGTMTDKVCGAGDILLAAVVAADQSGSKAFQSLRSFLPNKISLDVPDPRKLRAVRLSRSLGESWIRYHGQGNWDWETHLWGRDLIAITLLAEHDPTLYDFCVNAEVPPDILQDTWYQFLGSETNRKEPPDYQQIWSAAGVPLPGDRISQPASAYLVTATTDAVSTPFTAMNFASFKDDDSGEAYGTLINRHQLNRGDRLYVLAGERGEARIIRTGTVREPTPVTVVEQKGASFTPDVEVEWYRPDGAEPPIIDHATLLTIDREIDTWSLKSTGLRLRPEQAAGFDTYYSVVSGAKPPAPPAPPPDILHYAKTLSDLDHKNDWIGIRPDVEALSTLVAVDQVKPPLSVAIFGDWGSGKTFLLRKIQERVDVLEQLGQQTRADQEAAGEASDPDHPHYCSSILQIEFNAWHYTESNLWASLVNTIFERIYDTLSVDQPETDKPVDELFKNFETARHARQAAEEETERLSDELTEARTVTSTATTDADDARDHLAATVARSVWTRLDEVIKAEGSKRPDQVEKLEQAFAHFGFKQALTSAQTIDDTVSRFQSVSGRAREVFGSLVATPRGLIGAAVVVLLTAAATFVASKFQVQISSLGTAIAASLAWLVERGATANKWLDRIEAFSNWFAVEKQQAENEQAAEIESARADLELKQAALLAAQQRQQEAARHESRAKAELESLTARDQMRRFVDERVTSRAYAQHLGLVSMIRSDFEELTRFMHRSEETEEIELVERIEKETLDKIPTIDRIVLYIDDLDRCQPDRVVEVLEAIHLLLAFRLFIVIVAVDPRWVLESLSQKYEHLTRSRPQFYVPTAAGPLATRGTGFHTAATAHDYLEKIFHIPFWVKPMAPVACEKLIEGFLDLGALDGEQDAHRSDRELERFHSLENVDVDDVAEQEERPATEAAVPDETPDTKANVEPAVLLKAEKERRREQETVTAAAHIRTVVITADEETYIRRLAPYLGNSPRRVKRFANSYRLIKSGLSRAETDRMNTGNDHRIVLSFLAVVTGAPNLAPGIFVDILEKRGKKLNLRAMAKGLQGGGDPARRQEILSARGALGMLDGTDVSREQVEMWVPRVIRHAFRMIPGSLPMAGEAKG